MAENPMETVFQHDFFDTTSVTDFMLRVHTEAPQGYPGQRIEDSYTSRPFARSYDKRRQAFFEHVHKNPASQGIKGFYYELVRLYTNHGPVHEGIIRAALQYINERYDCADFVMLGIVRLLYQFKDSNLVSPVLLSEAGQTLLNFKYWPDEPGIDSMCYWTENHQIMFSCNEYLAGQLYPDRIFSNSGMNGFEKMQKSRGRIIHWLKMRYLTGFSEWLSNIYYDEDLTALINLVDFCRDPLIVRLSEMVIDLLLLDMGLNTFQGAFGSTHGRSYTREKMSALFESTTDTQKLMFGMGIFSGQDNMSAASLALSEKYRMPRLLYEIAIDEKRSETVSRQRMGIKLKEAERWGLDLKNPDDVMTLLTLEAYAHPRTFNGVMDLFDRYRWWENQFFSMFKKMKPLIRILRYSGLGRVLTRIMEKDICRNTREEVNIYTYKTPDYMLSSAQDYRKGYGGDQQHIWQATLSPDAVCFTTHPGHAEDTSAGNWLGSGSLPRVAQHKNVLIAVYRISRMPGIYMTNKLFYTHAWVPKGKFDEIREDKGWIFGRKGDAYIALYSQNTYRWQTSGKYSTGEIIAEGLKNIWICELGRKASDGDFTAFCGKIAVSEVVFTDENVRYRSPSRGWIEFGWRGPLLVNDKEIALGDYPRHDNPYGYAPFPPQEIILSMGEHSLRLDFERGIRDADSFVS